MAATAARRAKRTQSHVALAVVVLSAVLVGVGCDQVQLGPSDNGDGDDFLARSIHQARDLTNAGRKDEAAAVLREVTDMFDIDTALTFPGYATVLMHDVGVIEHHRGRTEVAKHIFHQAITYLALSAMNPVEMAVIKQYNLGLQTVLLDLGSLVTASAASRPESELPWAPRPPSQDDSSSDVTSSSWDPARIAVVSLCQYDPAQSPLTALSASNKLRYTSRHGYRLFFETRGSASTRPPAWSKVQLVQQYLQDFDWVMWMDCDSFFMNDSLPLTDLLPGRNDPSAAHIDIVLSEDGLSINTGVFFVRNSSWMRTFLNQWYGRPSSLFVNHPHWEQGALQTMLSRSRSLGLSTAVPDLERSFGAEGSAAGGLAVKNLLNPSAALPFPRTQSCTLGLGDGSECTPEDHAYAASLMAELPEGSGAPPRFGGAPLPASDMASPADTAAPRTLLLPQRWLNSYPEQLASNLRDETGRATHAAYSPGDFIVSFSGCAFMLGPTRCWELFDDYYELSEQMNGNGFADRITKAALPRRGVEFRPETGHLHAHSVLHRSRPPTLLGPWATEGQTMAQQIIAQFGELKSEM